MNSETPRQHAQGLNGFATAGALELKGEVDIFLTQKQLLIDNHLQMNI